MNENVKHGEVLVMVSNLPCDSCNYRTGQLSCWHFGEMTLAEIYNKAMKGCDYHRPWWTVSRVRNNVFG